MFTDQEREQIAAIAGETELIPLRLQDRSLPLIAMLLESGRSQRFFGTKPIEPEGFDHAEVAATVRELRWEGYVDIDVEDVDDDGIPDDVLLTGWKTNDTGIEFLRRLRTASGIESR